MTDDLLHRSILAVESQIAHLLTLKSEMDFFCVLRLALMLAAFE
jgi:hypothetical protein